MSSGSPKAPWFQRGAAAWGFTALAMLFIGSLVAAKFSLWAWPWLDGADWQAIWTFFAVLIAAIAGGIALEQLAAHRQAQQEQSRPYVIVDFSFRSTLLTIEVRNLGLTPARDIGFTWDIEPRSIGAKRDQVLKQNLVDGEIPFLAPGRVIRYPLGPASAYWTDSAMPKRFEVTASYLDVQGHNFGAGERMVLDLTQWAETLADVDYDNKNWNELDRQTKAQQKISTSVANLESHLNSLRESVTVLGTQLVMSGLKGEDSKGVSWMVLPEGGSARRIVNIGKSTAENVEVTDVTNDSGSSGFNIDDDLPRQVDRGGFILARMDRSLADPFRSSVRIQWTEEGAGHEATLSIS